MDLLETRKQLPAREAVALSLREAIIDGTFLPDQILKEQEVADALGFSRVPVREGLRLLETANLVQVIHGKGVQVAGLDFKAIREEFELRLLIEPQAAVRAAQIADPADITELRELTEKVRSSLDKAETRQASRRNAEFHTGVVRLARNDLMTEVTSGLWNALRLTLLLSRRNPGFEFVDLNLELEHQELLAAIQGRDSLAAWELSAGHIHKSFDHQRRVFLELEHDFAEFVSEQSLAYLERPLDAVFAHSARKGG